MASKATIAVLDGDGETGQKIASLLSKSGHNLLIVVEDITVAGELTPGYKNQTIDATIEFVDCLKDACWEADIIILPTTNKLASILAKRFREVATQKIVLLLRPSLNVDIPVLNQDASGILKQFGAILPDSKLVTGIWSKRPGNQFLYDKEANDFHLSELYSEHPDAIRTIRLLFEEIHSKQY